MCLLKGLFITVFLLKSLFKSNELQHRDFVMEFNLDNAGWLSHHPFLGSHATSLYHRTPPLLILPFTEVSQEQ